MKPEWPDWGRPDVRGAAGVAPFRSTREVVSAITEIVALAANPEGSASELRSRADAFAVRIAAVREDGGYARVHRALGLSPIAWWFLQSALVWELVRLPRLDEPPTVAGCAQLASLITGRPMLDGIAASSARLRWLELIAITGGDALHARPVRVTPRVLELALADEPAPSPFAILREPSDAAAHEPALVDRIGEALAARPRPSYIGDRKAVRAIVAVATELGMPVMIAGAADPPGAIVREALLADALIVVVDGAPHHPAWSLHRHGVLLVGEPPVT